MNKIFLTGIKNIVIKIAYANTFNQTQANMSCVPNNISSAVTRNSKYQRLQQFKTWY